MRYKVFGPFPFCTTKGVSHHEALRQFWADRDKDSRLKGLCDALGVYVWTIKQSGKRVPWNVGMTSKGFQLRFPNKEATILRLLMDQPNAEIEVYLLARLTKNGRFSKTSQTKLNNWLEAVLIGAAFSVNPGLRNTAKCKFIRDTVVDGYLNDKEEERNKSARSFSALFKARPRKRN